jgi:Tfp pilus assembly protein PilX
MSTGAIVAIIVVILIIAALLIAFATSTRRRRLRNRFGPEYDRAVSEHDSRREAEAALAQRERRVRELDIRPLSPTARAQYSSEWTAVQEQFVDAPQAAVTGAQTLVSAVLRDRGYPTDAFDQEVADLSVEHAATLDHFRAAHAISLRAGAGTASTEDLRQAMIHYRALFAELLGQSEDGLAATSVATTYRRPADEPPAGGAPGDPEPASGRPASGLPTAPAAGEPAAATDSDLDPAVGDPVASPRRER